MAAVPPPRAPNPVSPDNPDGAVDVGAVAGVEVAAEEPPPRIVELPSVEVPRPEKGDGRDCCCAGPAVSKSPRFSVEPEVALLPPVFDAPPKPEKREPTGWAGCCWFPNIARGLGGREKGAEVKGEQGKLDEAFNYPS